MSGDSPPPKPKVGSLRDRIAAFETKPQAPAAPAPRPKVGHVQWKPKPPSSPPPSTSDGDKSKEEGSPKEQRTVKSGMSAQDAKASIGMGGSLKERMAALQSKNTFGAPAPPPKPASDKPKWKPPPPPVAPPVEEEEEVSHNTEAVQEPKASSEAVDVVESQEPSAPSGDSAEQDEEEEERQRRAAIAARLARLGGTRVGMGPPVFGMKPPVKKPEKRLSSEDVASTHHEESTDSKERSIAENADGEAGRTRESEESPGAEPKMLRKESQASLASFDSASSHSARSPPTSMPMPLAPKRAGPPRKRSAKSPSPSATEALHSESPAADDKESDKLPEPSSEAVANAAITTSVVESESVRSPDEIDSPERNVNMQAEAPAHEESSIDVPQADVDDDAVSKHADETAQEENAVEEQPEEEEEDEEARRKRIAERIAQAGGFNPFAGGLPRPPPRRQSSTASSSTPAVEHHDTEHHSKESTEVIEEQADDEPSAQISSTSADINAGPSVADVHDGKHEEVEDGLESDSGEVHQDDHAMYEDVSESNEISEEVDEYNTSSRCDTLNSEAHGLREVEGNDVSDFSEEDERIENNDADDAESTNIHLNVDHQALVSDGEDEHISEDEDEMGPPRILRPLPPVPAEEDNSLAQEPKFVPTANVTYSFEDISECSAPPPLPPKRRSLPPPRSLLPPPPQSALPDIPSNLPPSEPVDAGSHNSSRDDLATCDDEAEDNEEEEDQSSHHKSPQRPLPGKPRLSIISARSEHEDEEERDSRFPPTPTFPPPPPLPPNRPMRSGSLTPALIEAVRMRSPPMSPPVMREAEFFDDADGDPIDPSFHSPSRSSLASLPESHQRERSGSGSGSRASDAADSGNDASKKRTIGERMTRLGSFKFAMPSLSSRPSRAAPSNAEDDEDNDDEEGNRHKEVIPSSSSPTPEDEDEVARKARISAKLAGMGALRMGLFAPIASPPRRQASSAKEEKSRASPPPIRATDNDEHSPSVSGSDMSKIDADESEPDEITHEEAGPSGAHEEEVPPPVPSRFGRPSGTRRQSSDFREDIPLAFPAGKRPTSPPATGQLSRRGTNSSPRKLSKVWSDRPVSPTGGNYAGEFVMVDEPEQIGPPVPQPPPRRASLMSSKRGSYPPPAPPPPPTSGSANSGDWSLPTIPMIPPLDFEGQTDLSASGWSEDSTSYPPPPPPPPPPPSIPPIHTRPSTSSRSTIGTLTGRNSADRVVPAVSAPVPVRQSTQLNADQLLELWGRVGSHISEKAAMLFDKSRKALIGDGTYHGFVMAVLEQVPNAVVPSVQAQHDYGHLIYMQSGGTVQKRIAEIMPGDVVLLDDARFKGHKGLHQSYQQIVGADGNPVVGIVGDFEQKKSKLKVYEANQHVGSQTVEMVSYRLEDLKSGTVIIYRVSDV